MRFVTGAWAGRVRQRPRSMRATNLLARSSPDSSSRLLNFSAFAPLNLNAIAVSQRLHQCQFQGGSVHVNNAVRFFASENGREGSGDGREHPEQGIGTDSSSTSASSNNSTTVTSASGDAIAATVTSASSPSIEGTKSHEVTPAKPRHVSPATVKSGDVVLPEGLDVSDVTRTGYVKMRKKGVVAWSNEGKANEPVSHLGQMLDPSELDDVQSPHERKRKTHAQLVAEKALKNREKVEFEKKKEEAKKMMLTEVAGNRALGLTTEHDELLSLKRKEEKLKEWEQKERRKEQFYGITGDAIEDSEQGFLAWKARRRKRELVIQRKGLPEKYGAQLRIKNDDENAGLDRAIGFGKGLAKIEKERVQNLTEDMLDSATPAEKRQELRYTQRDIAEREFAQKFPKNKVRIPEHLKDITPAQLKGLEPLPEELQDIGLYRLQREYATDLILENEDIEIERASSTGMWKPDLAVATRRKDYIHSEIGGEMEKILKWDREVLGIDAERLAEKAESEKPGLRIDDEKLQMLEKRMKDLEEMRRQRIMIEGNRDSDGNSGAAGSSGGADAQSQSRVNSTESSAEHQVKQQVENQQPHHPLEPLPTSSLDPISRNKPLTMAEKALDASLNSDLGISQLEKQLKTAVEHKNNFLKEKIVNTRSWKEWETDQKRIRTGNLTVQPTDVKGVVKHFRTRASNALTRNVVLPAHRKAYTVSESMGVGIVKAPVERAVSLKSEVMHLHKQLGNADQKFLMSENIFQKPRDEIIEWEKDMAPAGVEPPWLEYKAKATLRAWWDYYFWMLVFGALFFFMGFLPRFTESLSDLRGPEVWWLHKVCREWEFLSPTQLHALLVRFGKNNNFPVDWEREPLQFLMRIFYTEIRQGAGFVAEASKEGDEESMKLVEASSWKRAEKDGSWKDENAEGWVDNERVRKEKESGWFGWVPGMGGDSSNSASSGSSSSGSSSSSSNGASSITDSPDAKKLGILEGPDGELFLDKEKSGIDLLGNEAKEGRWKFSVLETAEGAVSKVVGGVGGIAWEGLAVVGRGVVNVTGIKMGVNPGEEGADGEISATGTSNFGTTENPAPMNYRPIAKKKKELTEEEKEKEEKIAEIRKQRKKFKNAESDESDEFAINAVNPVMLGSGVCFTGDLAFQMGRSGIGWAQLGPFRLVTDDEAQDQDLVESLSRQALAELELSMPPQGHGNDDSNSNSKSNTGGARFLEDGTLIQDASVGNKARLNANAMGNAIGNTHPNNQIQHAAGGVSGSSLDARREMSINSTNAQQLVGVAGEQLSNSGDPSISNENLFAKDLAPESPPLNWWDVDHIREAANAQAGVFFNGCLNKLRFLKEKIWADGVSNKLPHLRTAWDDKECGWDLISEKTQDVSQTITLEEFMNLPAFTRYARKGERAKRYMNSRVGHVGVHLDCDSSIDLLPVLDWLERHEHIQYFVLSNAHKHPQFLEKLMERRKARDEIYINDTVERHRKTRLAKERKMRRQKRVKMWEEEQELKRIDKLKADRLAMGITEIIEDESQEPDWREQPLRQVVSRAMQKMPYIYGISEKFQWSLEYTSPPEQVAARREAELRKKLNPEKNLAGSGDATSAGPEVMSVDEMNLNWDMKDERYLQAYIDSHLPPEEREAAWLAREPERQRLEEQGGIDYSGGDGNFGVGSSSTAGENQSQTTGSAAEGVSGNGRLANGRFSTNSNPNNDPSNSNPNNFALDQSEKISSEAMIQKSAAASPENSWSGFRLPKGDDIPSLSDVLKFKDSIGEYRAMIPKADEWPPASEIAARITQGPKRVFDHYILGRDVVGGNNAGSGGRSTVTSDTINPAGARSSNNTAEGREADVRGKGNINTQNVAKARREWLQRMGQLEMTVQEFDEKVMQNARMKAQERQERQERQEKEEELENHDGNVNNGLPMDNLSSGGGSSGGGANSTMNSAANVAARKINEPDTPPPEPTMADIAAARAEIEKVMNVQKLFSKPILIDIPTEAYKDFRDSFVKNDAIDKRKVGYIVDHTQVKKLFKVCREPERLKSHGMMSAQIRHISEDKEHSMVTDYLGNVLVEPLKSLEVSEKNKIELAIEAAEKTGKNIAHLEHIKHLKKGKTIDELTDEEVKKIAKELRAQQLEDLKHIPKTQQIHWAQKTEPHICPYVPIVAKDIDDSKKALTAVENGASMVHVYDLFCRTGLLGVKDFKHELGLHLAGNHVDHMRDYVGLAVTDRARWKEIYEGKKEVKWGIK